jgi:multiple sugar transport system substrate-binding protein
MKSKKAMALTMVAALMLSATACSSGKQAAETTAPPTTAQESKAEETTTAGAQETEEAEDIKEVVFPDQLNNGEPCTIRFGWWGGQTRHERTEKVVKMFMEKYPNVTIETEPSDFNGYFQKLPTLVGAQDVWDVFQLGNNWAEYSSIVTDLNPYIKDGTINTDNISDGFLATTYDLGKQMEISLGTNAHCIIYNVDMLKKAGLSEPAENWTWKDYEEYSEALKDVTGEFGSSSLEEFYGACTVGVPQYESGLNFFKGDNSGLMIDKPDYMVPFIEMIQRMTESGSYPDRGALNEMGTAPEQNFVATGEAAMTWALSNQVVAMAKAAEENGVGTLRIATIPRITSDGPSGYAVKSSQGLTIYSQTKYPEVCAAFINFFINSPEANQILLGERGVPVTSAVRAAVQPSLSDLEKDIYAYVASVGSWKESKDVFINEPSQQNAIKDEFKNQMDRVNAGEITAQDAAKNVFDFATNSFKR